VLSVLAFGPIAYANVAPDAGTAVFDWLLALSGLSTLFTWGVRASSSRLQSFR
jgi:amino acid transporter